MAKAFQKNHFRNHNQKPYEKKQQQNQKQNHSRRPQPKITKRPLHLITFPKENLKLNWKVTRTVGPGLINAGNTCFLNSVLQCLTYTPAFTQYILGSSHSEKCRVIGYCALCAIERHCNRCFLEPKSFKKQAAILPSYFTSNLKRISNTLRLGYQEDAHEFLILLLAAFQKSFTFGFEKVPPQLEESTPIHQIFGGKIRSQLKCYSCKATSDTYEPLLDLSLDLTKTNSVEEALKRFTEVDVIGSDPDNRYNCSKCKQKVKAGKQMTIYQHPPMLNLHLKRFAFSYQSGSMSKISKFISYPETLDIAPYISKDKKKNHGDETTYDLHGVLVHQGGNCNYGHYFAYIKDPKDDWYRMDDESVTKATKKEVLGQKAYMLFYNTRQTAVTTTPIVANLLDKKDILSKAIEEERKEALKLKSILSQKRKLAKLEEEEEAKEEDQIKKKKKRVQIEEPPCSDQPLAWYVQNTTETQRSLRGVLSPPTYGAAVSDKSSWTEINMNDFKKYSQDKSKKRYRRKYFAGKSLNFTIGILN